MSDSKDPKDAAAESAKDDAEAIRDQANAAAEQAGKDAKDVGNAPERDQSIGGDGK